MAFRHGRWSEITINSVAMSAYCDALDFGIEIDTADTTTFGKVAKTHVVGTYGAELGGGGNYDPTATTGPEAVLEALVGADSVPVVCYPGGNTGDPIQRTRTFQATLTSFKEGSKIGDKVTFSFTFLVNGEVAFGDTD